MIEILNPFRETPLESIARRVARRLGVKLMTEWGMRGRRDERNMHALFRRSLQSDSCCVDIGANRGDILRPFIQLSPKGRHFAFEPIPALAESLQVSFPGVQVFNCALSDKPGSATFFLVPDRDAWSGLRRQEYPDDAQPVEITVDLKPLDDVIGNENQVDFIKIDVEGAELEVLRGAIKTLKRCRPTVVFEHAKIHNQNYDTTADMIYDLLVNQCGMEICDLPLSETFTRERFIEVYETSAASGYDRNAQTNFVARPTS